MGIYIYTVREFYLFFSLMEFFMCVYNFSVYCIVNGIMQNVLKPDSRFCLLNPWSHDCQCYCAIFATAG